MNAGEIVAEIEAAGGVLSLEDGGHIVYEIPPKVKPLLGELRARKAEVIAILRARESADCVRRFGQGHAKLFPFIGRKVRTPDGPGTLLQVFADRATVILDSELSQCRVFSPSEVEPVSGEGAEKS